MPNVPAVAFLRPRLGIGGSERLVLDAAIALQHHGCGVRIVVPGPLEGPHFEEVLSKELDVLALPTRVPADLRGRLRAPLAIARTLRAARALISEGELPDLVFCDVVAHVVPRVKRMTGRPVVFYCHFPDLLLAPGRSRRSFSYELYRGPIDRSEARGLASADRVLVNSRFTAGQVRRVFPGLADDALEVVLPGVHVPAVPRHSASAFADDGPIVLLSISRFDPQKNLPLAVNALAALRPLVAAPLFARLHLILAGRFDQNLPEQRDLVRTLRARADALGLAPHVSFVFSPRSDERDEWLARSRCVLYTPEAEHFGYVPIEAMAAGRPVVAADVGGPTETILDGLTGVLCRPTPQAFAEGMRRFVEDAAQAQACGAAGRAHVARHFSTEAFGERLWKVISPFLSRGAPPAPSPGS